MTCPGEKCQHGYDGEQETSADEDERTACCGAFCTFTDDGVACKCCWALVTGGDPVDPFEVIL